MMSLGALNDLSQFDTAHGNSVHTWAQLAGKTYTAHLTKNKFTLSDKQDSRIISVTSIRNGKVSTNKPSCSLLVPLQCSRAHPSQALQCPGQPWLLKAHVLLSWSGDQDALYLMRPLIVWFCFLWQYFSVPALKLPGCGLKCGLRLVCELQSKITSRGWNWNWVWKGLCLRNENWWGDNGSRRRF